MSTTPGSQTVHADKDTDTVGRKSHFDKGAGATAIWIFQGDFYVSSRPDLFLTAVLGSCIAVCVRDPIAGCGGMNHFLLPETETGTGDDHYPSQALRYGSYSIERLINAILSRGGRRERLEVKVFGGANVMSGMSDVGSRNVDFIEHYFANERLPIAAADLRGTWPRKLRYFPISGCAQVRELRDREADEALQAEVLLRSRASVAKPAGEIEIFK